MRGAAVPVLMSPIEAFSDPGVWVSLCHKLLLLPSSFAMCQSAPLRCLPCFGQGNDKDSKACQLIGIN